MSKTQIILQALEPMKAEAREKGLVFQHTGMHKEIRLTVGELEEANANGKFIWGPVNWRLEKP